MALLLLVAACGGKDASQTSATPTSVATEAPSPAPTTVPPPSPTPRPPPRPPAGAVPFPPEARAEAEQLLARVAEIRKSPPRGEIQMFLITRQSAIDYYTPAQSNPDETRGTSLRQTVYSHLGLVPERIDVAQQGVAYLGTQITGFYDSDHKAFYLLQDQGGPGSAAGRATIVHEFTHALEDQYYDLNALGERVQDNWDATRAFFSTIEGDALNTETVFYGRPLRNQNPCFTLPVDRGGATPYTVQRDLNSWYDDGLCFVTAVLPKLPEGFDSLFKRLPTTTEQLLHPERYLAGEGARPVTPPPLAPALGPGWREQGKGVLGEYTLQNLLMVGLSGDRPRVQRAAEGWGGDAWTVYQRDDVSLLHVETAWDSPEDAGDFFQSLRVALGNRGSGLQVAETSLRHEREGKTWRVALRGDTVTLVISADVEAADAAALRLGMP